MLFRSTGNERYLRPIRRQCPCNVFGDGLQALSERLKSQIQKGGLELTAEEKAENARKQELLDQSIAHL